MTNHEEIRAEVQRLIDESVHSDSVPVLDLRDREDAQDVYAAVLVEADDVTGRDNDDGSETADCWGTREDGEGWRIHVITEVSE